MKDQRALSSLAISETGTRVNAVAEWRSILAAITGGVLLYLTLSGFVIFLLPFSEFNQFNVLIHTIVGLLSVAPVCWYMVRHWLVRKKGNLSHYQLLGYVSFVFVMLCIVSGIVVTWQGIFGPALSYTWDMIHLVGGACMFIFIVVHLATVIVRKINNPEALQLLRTARNRFFSRSLIITVVCFAIGGVWAIQYAAPELQQGFDSDYNWKFGDDQPFSPSLARVENSEWVENVQTQVLGVLGNDQARSTYLASFEKSRKDPIGLFDQVRQCLDQFELTDDKSDRIEAIFVAAAEEIKRNGAIDPRALAGSAGCGSSGCHQEIYEEWLPSAHRYSSLDTLFQRVQTIMADELTPEHTRYCAGCHDPISLLSGAKNTGNITLSAKGADEGASCVFCHSIVQTDVQGNGDYTVQLQQRYAYELDEGSFAKFTSDFLIRTYPQQHVNSFSRSLYKTTEFCAGCHKQYIDELVNTDIGKVQGQNQYDSWRNSRWNHEGDPTKTVSCRECHMPLVASNDPARGDVTDYNRSPDDKRHRSHRVLGSNQYIPLWHKLEGAEKHTELIEQWLRGEYEIEEIADKWTTGPVVRMDIESPEQVMPGEEVSLQVILTNNKTGHEFPTGPLDMIESWVEIIVTSDRGEILYHTGALDEDGFIVEPQILLRADVFDRRGEPIDRHNLWDLVGASYKRTLYPGATDTVQVQFQCPSMSRKRVAEDISADKPVPRSDEFVFQLPPEGVADEITVTAILWYRKANPEFLDTVYGKESGMRAPVTEMTRTSTTIKVIDHAAPTVE